MEHKYFTDENTWFISCLKTGGSFAVKLWDYKMTQGLCPCCNKPIEVTK